MANDWSDVEDNDRAIRDVVNGQLQNENLASSAAIAHNKLAAIATGRVLLGNGGTPTATTLSGDASVAADGTVTHASNAVYRSLLTGSGDYPSSTAGTLIFSGGLGGLFAAANFFTSTINPQVIYLDPADYAITGRTTKLRLRAHHITGGTAPGVTFNVGLSTVSVNPVALSAFVAGSTVTFTTTAANTLAQGNSGDFTIPSAGYYVIAVTNSGTTAASGGSVLSYQLQLRHV